jgi:two-component system cell cycle sensor histidine kinase/response regulator CckA
MKPRILVMDDDESIRKICTLLLTRLGYDVDTTTCGEEAIASFEKSIKDKTPYLAVILDLTVQSGMGGLETLKKLRVLDSQVYAIMASGSSIDNMLLSFQSHGFKDVLPKPFRVQDLTDCMLKLKPAQS